MRISDWSSDVCSSDLDVAVLRKCDSCDRSQKTSSVGVGHAPNSDRQGALKPGAWLLHSRTAFSVLGLLAGCHAFDEAGSEVMLPPALQALVTKTAVIDAGSVAVHGKCFVLKTGRDRKSIESGKSVSVRVDLGGRRFLTQKNNN